MMRKLAIAVGGVFLLLFVLIGVYVAMLPMRAARAPAPTERMAPTPDSPNAVSSMADPGDAEHFIEALPAGTSEAWVAVLEGMGGSVVVAEADYVHATFTSDGFGFIDDVELMPGSEQTQVRSASRFGYSDMGVNRERVEALRAAAL